MTHTDGLATLRLAEGPLVSLAVGVPGAGVVGGVAVPDGSGVGDCDPNGHSVGQSAGNSMVLGVGHGDGLIGVLGVTGTVGVTGAVGDGDKVTVTVGDGFAVEVGGGIGTTVGPELGSGIVAVGPGAGTVVSWP